MARLRTIGRRDPSVTRRSRVTLGIAALVALVILATSFPLSGLLSQHRQLSAAAAQLNQLRRSNQQLTQHLHQLNSPSAVGQLARERYQLVAPGSTLYEVLPPGGHRGAAGAATSGDPGNQPLVAPANAPDLSPDPNLTSPHAGPASPAPSSPGSSSAASGPKPGPTTFWFRVGQTLEFWR